MIESPPEARELARIHRIQEDTVEDQTNLTTFFKMLIDGEALLLKVQYNKEIQQLRAEMAKFRAIASGRKSITDSALTPFIFINHQMNMRFAVLLQKNGHSFKLIVEDSTRWSQIPYFAPTRSLTTDETIDNFSALILANDTEILNNNKTRGWYGQEQMNKIYEEKIKDISKITKLHIYIKASTNTHNEHFDQLS